MLAALASGSDPVVIDFSGVAAITTGFADEFIGKLVKALGFTLYSERVRLKNVDREVGRHINIAVAQRLSQD